MTRVDGNISNLAIECAKNGLDWEDVLIQKAREQKKMIELGLSPSAIEPDDLTETEKEDEDEDSETDEPETPDDGGSVKYTIGIDVGVQRRIQGTKEETVESMTALVDEIADHLMETPLAEFPAAQWLSLANDPLYFPEHLTQKRVFTGVLTVKYLLFA